MTEPDHVRVLLAAFYLNQEMFSWHRTVEGNDFWFDVFPKVAKVTGRAI